MLFILTRANACTYVRMYIHMYIFITFRGTDVMLAEGSRPGTGE